MCGGWGDGHEELEIRKRRGSGEGWGEWHRWGEGGGGKDFLGVEIKGWVLPAEIMISLLAWTLASIPYLIMKVKFYSIKNAVLFQPKTRKQI